MTDRDYKAAAQRRRPHSDPSCKHASFGHASNLVECQLCPGCGGDVIHVAGAMTSWRGVFTYVDLGGEVQTVQGGGCETLIINGHPVWPDDLDHAYAGASDRPHAFVIGDCELCGVTFALRFLDYKGNVFADALLIRTTVEEARNV